MRRWWQEAIVYQIYPRSYQDTDGDGLGDLRGILGRVDHLADLGIDAVWLTPIYPSPNADNGYDVADYRSIGPEYGTFDDWVALRDALHARGIRLIMDLVVNHTSDRHPWFQAARSSRDNPYRDYYIWRPGRAGGPPNNWAAAFGGPAWTYDEATGEYYLHLFSPHQPDLNWENPAVRREVADIMRFWLEHGVDGFRMDVINMISKVPGLPDVPGLDPGEIGWASSFFLQGPRLGDYLRELREQVLDEYDAIAVGEAPGATTEHALDIARTDEGPLHMLLHFEHVDIGGNGDTKWQRQAWELKQLKHVVTRWQKELEDRGWNSFYLSNHDQPRAVSRFGDDGEHRETSAKLLATFLLTLQCTPYIYQGEEIGMTNARFPDITYYRDIETLNYYSEALESGLTPREALEAIHRMSRDNARTPMHWSAEPHAGFTTGVPWIDVNPNYREINVAAQRDDPESVLCYYRRMITARRETPALVYGTYELVAEQHEQIFAYTRSFADDRLLVVLNFSGENAPFFASSHVDCTAAELIIGNLGDPWDELPELCLRPWEARVYRIG